MKNVLFYNDQTGAGAVGVIEASAFQTTESFDDGSFALGWTHIDGVDRLLFYNQATGAAAIGDLSQGHFKTIDSFNPGFFATGWTHVIPTGFCTLFYKAQTGEGAIVVLSPSPHTTKSFPAGGFARDWTHIALSRSNATLILFYNSTTGSAAICEQFSNLAPNPGGFSQSPNDLRTIKNFGAGSFASGWSHIVDAGGGQLLFYNTTTGEGAVGTLSTSGFTTTQSFGQGAFKAGWTKIVNVAGSILFYNASDGSAAIGFNPTVKVFPPGSFGTWTHLAFEADLIPPR